MDLEPTIAGDSPFRRDENQIHFILNVLEKHWLLIILLTLLTALVAVGLQHYRSDRSRAPQFSASLELAHKRLPFSAQGPNSNINASSAISLGELRRNLEMPALAERVALSARETHPNLAPATVARALRVEVRPGDPEILEVGARTTSGADAAAIAEHAVAAIIEIERELRERRQADEQAYLEEELKALAEGLQGATARELAYLQEHEFSTYQEIADNLRAQNKALEEIYSKRAVLLTEWENLEAEIDLAQENLPGAFSRLSDAVITNLVTELQTLLKQELSLSTVYQTAYPPLLELREEIVEKEHTISAAVQRYEAGDDAGLRAWERLKAMRERNAALQLELESLDQDERNVAQRATGLSEQLPEAAETTQEYTRIAFDVAGFRERYNKALELDFNLRVAMRAGAGKLEALGSIRVEPLPPEVPQYFDDLIAGAVVGLMLSLGLSLLRESADTSVRSERDAHARFSQPIIGTIPDMQLRSVWNRWGLRRKRHLTAPMAANTALSPSIITFHEPKSPFSEAYRAVRTNLLFATFNAPFKTIMVTSAVPAEGKTTTSVNLANVLAQNGARVLLLDADLRRPHVHSVLGLVRSPGLSDVLAHGMDLHEVIQTTAIPNLMVIPSGHLPPNPSELLGSERLKELLARLGQEFDVIICDVPSVVVVTDALLLARCVDQVLMVVSVNNARRQTILRALEMLETSRCSIAGLVLNGLKPSRLRHYYYYYYYDDQARRKQKRWFHA